MIHKININIAFEKISLKIWGHSVEKLKEKDRKTLKKRIICYESIKKSSIKSEE
jgi:pterin-4a-carbinolamine dehydratase